MENYQYLKMLLEGIINHPDHLPEYLNRRQLQAESEFVGFHEFMDRTISTIVFLEGELRNKMCDEKLKFSYCKNGKNNEEIDAITKGISMSDVTIHLSTYTRNQFQGSLALHDLSSIRFAINAAFEFTIEEREGARYQLLERKVNKKEKRQEEEDLTQSTSLDDFFTNGTPSETIKLLQTNFISYKGKRMAILIYILEKDLKLISYSPNDKTRSRKHFVSAFTESENCRMTGINKYLETYGDLKLNKTDKDFQDIKEKLAQLLN